MRRIGLERGKSFDIDKVDPTVKQALVHVPEDAQKLMAWKSNCRPCRREDHGATQYMLERDRPS